MDEHYITFADEDEPETVLLKVFPSELRRKYSLQNSNETTRIGVHAVLEMPLEYKQTDVIVRLGCCKGVPVLMEAVLVILKTLHPLEDIEATFQPANVKLGGSCIADVSDVSEWKKLVYFFFPNILATNKFGKHDLIELSTC